jgi:hypothetical protein
VLVRKQEGNREVAYLVSRLPSLLWEAHGDDGGGDGERGICDE